MARIGWIHHRLQVWQRWVLTRGGGVLGYAASNLLQAARAEGTPVALVPSDAIEASETHEAVMQLPREVMATVVEYYIGPGDERRKCERLAIHKATLHARLAQADKLLADMFEAGLDQTWRASVEPLADYIDRLELLIAGTLIADAACGDDSEGGFTD